MITQRQLDMVHFIEAHGDQVSTALYTAVAYWDDPKVAAVVGIHFARSQAREWQQVRDQFDSIHYGE